MMGYGWGTAPAHLWFSFGMPVIEHRGTIELQRLVELLAPLPPEWLRQGWAADPSTLQALAQQQRQGGALGQEPDRTVALVVLLWLAGLPALGDALLLELDRRRPELGLVPDWWGLGPGAGEEGPLPAVLAVALAWRHGVDSALSGAVLAAWRQQLAPALQAEPADSWLLLLEPSNLTLLALVLTPQGAADRMRGELEPVLVEAMGESVVEHHPQEAWVCWSGISQRCPSWAYARLKAADLSLQNGLLQRSAAFLAGATEEQRRNPWLGDIEARLAMAQGQPAEALRCWEVAIAAASGDGELVELLRQRRREAEWEVELVGVPQSTGPSGEAALDRFAERLEAVAQRFGVLLPHGAVLEGVADPEAFAAYLDAAGGRLALVG